MESGIADWLGPAELALRDGQLERAVACLEQAAAQPSDRLSKAWSGVRLAALYALQGASGLTGGLFHLLEARASYADITRTELYQALAGEFAAYQGARAATVRRVINPVLTGHQSEARFHAARALLAIGARNRAERLLGALDTETLPAYLVWRRWALLGNIYSAKANWEAATTAFEEVLNHLHPTDGFSERLELANCYLQLGKAESAFQILQAIDLCYVHDSEQRLHYLRLLTRAHSKLGNPNQALSTLLTAYSEAQAAQCLSADLLLELARLYRHLGNIHLAQHSYEQAQNLSGKEAASFIRHEHAIMLLEHQQAALARELLEAVTQDPHYPFIAEVIADSAECSLRLGDTKMANLLARCAHAAGAVAPAGLLLAEIALDSCNYSGALEWLGQVISAATEGSGDWVTAHLYMVEALVWAGPGKSDRVVHHGELALRYLEPSSTWIPILERHLTNARQNLFGMHRFVN
jgi:hypothetical protein